MAKTIKRKYVCPVLYETEGLHIHGACAYFVRRICNMHLDSIDLCWAASFRRRKHFFRAGFSGAWILHCVVIKCF